MASSTYSGPAPKRRKISPPPTSPSATTQHQPQPSFENTMAETRKYTETAIGLQSQKENQVGILCFVNDTNPGFSGVLKQRFTDFLVNEINLDGEVIHLTTTAAPKLNGGSHASGSTTCQEFPDAAESSQKPELRNGKALAETETAIDVNVKLAAEDEALLDSYLGPEVRDMVVKLYERILKRPNAKAAVIGSVLTNPITDKTKRTTFHQDIRRIFKEKLETAADAEGIIKISMFSSRKPPSDPDGIGRRTNRGHYQQKGKLGWEELGGEYLHFSLYKENKDTMEVISFMAAKLQMRNKGFSFAGTKDRRGVTVQRVSVHRMRSQELMAVNKVLRGSKIGNFKHEKRGLALGDLAGNEFLVTLRDCQFKDCEGLNETQRVNVASQIVGDAVKNIKSHGFINYFGLQRFGSYNIGTDDVGLKILQGDFENAVSCILSYSKEALEAAENPNLVPSDGKLMSRDDIQRAQALHIFKTTKKAKQATDILPRKFSAENTIIRHLDRHGHGQDFLGALLGINRNLKLMYVHAYQSRVWNMVASERWARFGPKVIEGDLVIVDHGTKKNGGVVMDEEVDQNGEIVVLPAADDIAISNDEMFERARPITAEEADSGKYSIFDIVLPTPGYDIEYPANEIGDYYKNFMGSDRGGGLDPADMRRTQKDFSLSGSYRKLLARVGNDISFQIKLYRAENEQMVETDLDRMNNGKQQQAANSSNAWTSREEHHAQGKTIQESNRTQQNAWVNLPRNLAADDKKTLELLFQKESSMTGSELAEEFSQPSLIDSFIETSPEKGQRTGHREITTFVTPVGSTSTPSTAIPEPPALSLTVSQRGVKNRSISLADSKSSDSNGGGEIPGNYVEEAAIEEQAAKEQLASEMEHGLSIPTGTGSEEESKIYTEEQAAKEPDASEVVWDVSVSSVAAIEEGAKRSAEVAFGNGGTKVEEKGQDPRKIAVIVKFQLGSSQYATMALRELMKQGGVQTYKPDFSGGR